MAKVQWRGDTFHAEPVRQLPNGNWIMRAQEHGARFCPGTEIEVRSTEIVEMAAPEEPAADQGLSRLNAAMAEERKTLTPVTELLKNVRTVANAGRKEDKPAAEPKPLIPPKPFQKQGKRC